MSGGPGPGSRGAKVGVEYLEPERSPGTHALPGTSVKAKAKVEIQGCAVHQGLDNPQKPSCGDKTGAEIPRA